VTSQRIPPGPVDAYDTEQELLNWLREKFDQFGDIYGASIYGTRVYVISAPEYVEHVLLKNWQHYVKGQAIKRIALLLGKGLMVSEGDFWISQRRMIQPAFHRKVIGALTDVISAGNRALLADWEQAAQKNSSVNVTRDLSRTVLQVVLRSIFGEDYTQVAPHFNMLSDQPERSLEFADAFRPLADIVIRLAVQRRAANRSSTDILGMLMAARDREGGQVMPDRQLAREIMTLVVAGHETTASVLNWTWYLLSQHAAVEEKLNSELNDLLEGGFPSLDELPKFSYTRQVIEEAMRLYPPGWLMTRKALQDDYLGEYFVPAGTEIYIAPYLIQRHPDLWKQPDRFDPDRFAPEQSQSRHALAMLPFSAGPRNCIGEFFARIEMQIHLMIIARRLRLRFVEIQPPELVGGVNLLSKHDFIMTPEIKESAEKPYSTCIR
jgi:cytochrome P450